MSLVGTRPPTVDEWDKYELHHRARLATKPGLTGMWQVSGRSNITDFEEVVKLDKQYMGDKDILKAEYLLPIYIDELLQAGRVSVKVLDTNDKWFGVTYKEDKDYVVKSFVRLIEDTYTPSLFVKNFILPKEREEGIAVEN